MPQGIDDAVRNYQLPQNSPTQLYLSQYNLASNTPVYITPGLGASGAGNPPLKSGHASFNITVTHYVEQAAVESKESTEV